METILIVGLLLGLIFAKFYLDSKKAQEQEAAKNHPDDK